MSTGDDTITARELEEYFQRRQQERNVMGGASHEAAKIVRDILTHREPEYETGEVYISARSVKYYLHPDRGDGLVWLDIQSGEQVRHGVPQRPLRKLVPEGSQAAPERWEIQAEVASSRERDETDRELTDRICKLLDGTS